MQDNSLFSFVNKPSKDYCQATPPPVSSRITARLSYNLFIDVLAFTHNWSTRPSHYSIWYMQLYINTHVFSIVDEGKGRCRYNHNHNSSSNSNNSLSRCSNNNLSRCSLKKVSGPARQSRLQLCQCHEDFQIFSVSIFLKNVSLCELYAYQYIYQQLSFES